MSITYYRNEYGGYLGITTETAMGGTVFVGRGPDRDGGPDTVREQAYHVNQLKRMTKVDPRDVPDQWMVAIGYEEPRVEPIEPVIPWQPEREPEEITVYDIRFPWEVPSRPATTEQRRFASNMLAAGVVLGILWWFIL
ncbi:MAG: hypothetical protein DWQ31_17150 [Planctomycetota bacterium]|nr:MAG: hypothetical protein DWQ31_17150 [Planctomycetota bacterium]REJ92081.1 MAG: hypothetical protein DWQ35_13100 [Planctomycetota bacterium]REK28617.1 MAG: hypothetical protein DWQ42_04690 [Planctomycetota bacterium]REK39231.1 MAG: hypothetical protein DWQ46_18270 [Planctomycetota bacterium]